MEIVQQNMSEMTEAACGRFPTPTRHRPRRPGRPRLLKLGYERAVANIKEISDMIQQSNTEALKLLNQRFTEAMDEVKLLANKPKA